MLRRFNQIIIRSICMTGGYGDAFRGKQITRGKVFGVFRCHGNQSDFARFKEVTNFIFIRTPNIIRILRTRFYGVKIRSFQMDSRGFRPTVTDIDSSGDSFDCTDCGLFRIGQGGWQEAGHAVLRIATCDRFQSFLIGIHRTET
ncbi:MAG: hypothetical protein BWY58_00812 [Chloroflexi bacterium ADurb.Bin344]|nr:MAG: hypothetical protein BWY58_00812 [Chloroflexi bacterium ADurb.Bin344]